MKSLVKKELNIRPKSCFNPFNLRNVSEGEEMRALSLALFCYGVLFFIIAKIPEKHWDYFTRSLLSGLFGIKKYFKGLKRTLPFLKEQLIGQELLLAFGELESKLLFGQKILPDFLPKYKFYTSLLEQLLEANRGLGIKIKKFIPEIRSGLIRDLQFEKKILEEVFSGFFQCLVIAGTTWSFVFLSSSLSKVPLSFFILLCMLILQLTGVCIFFLLVKKIKKKLFGKFIKAFSEMYLFNAFLEIGLPIGEVLKKSGILEGQLMASKSFEGLYLRLKKIIGRLKETGISPREEANEILAEIWHLQEDSFIKFTKIVQVLKFSVLAAFFLPAYFLYLYSLFQFFMEQ